MRAADVRSESMQLWLFGSDAKIVIVVMTIIAIVVVLVVVVVVNAIMSHCVPTQVQCRAVNGDWLSSCTPNPWKPNNARAQRTST